MSTSLLEPGNLRRQTTGTEYRIFTNIKNVSKFKQIHEDGKFDYNISTKLLIAVNIGNSSVLADTVSSLWIRIGKSKVRTVFITCSQNTWQHPNVVKDPEYPCDEYPPMRSWLVTFKLLSRFEQVDWFLKCDDDSYVNAPEVTKYLEGLEHRGVNPDGIFFFGSPGFGRQKERASMGLDNHSFPMGGPCVGLSAGAIRRLTPILDECMLKPMPVLHSDTQLAYCFQTIGVYNSLPYHSQAALGTLFRQMYTNEYQPLDGSHATPFKGSTVPWILSPWKQSPLTLHSIKDPMLMLHVHAQLHHGATPINATSNRARVRIRATPCFHNPALISAVTSCCGPAAPRAEPPAHCYAVDSCSISVRECPLRPASNSRPDNNSAAAVLSGAILVCDGAPQGCLNGALASALRRLGLRVAVVTAARPGAGAGVDSAARESLRAALEMAVRAGLDRSRAGVLVADGAARPHRNLTSRLSTAIAHPRCRCQLQLVNGGEAGRCPPGVLHLGMAEADPAVRDVYRKEAAAGAKCVNAFPQTHAGFATVYGGGVIRLALAWLNRRQGTVGDLFAHLSTAGLVVRGLPEPVVIPALKLFSGAGTMSLLPPSPAGLAGWGHSQWGWEANNFS